MSTEFEKFVEEFITSNEKYAFIVPNHFPKRYTNVFNIPHDYLESQNYAYAADICVIKSGWSTVSECLTMNEAMILIERKNIPGDVNTKKFLNMEYGVKSVKMKELRNVSLREAKNRLK